MDNCVCEKERDETTPIISQMHKFTQKDLVKVMQGKVVILLNQVPTEWRRMKEPRYNSIIFYRHYGWTVNFTPRPLYPYTNDTPWMSNYGCQTRYKRCKDKFGPLLGIEPRTGGRRYTGWVSYYGYEKIELYLPYPTRLCACRLINQREDLTERPANIISYYRSSSFR